MTDWTVQFADESMIVVSLDLDENDDDEFYDALVTTVRKAGHDPDVIEDWWPVIQQPNEIPS